MKHRKSGSALNNPPNPSGSAPLSSRANLAFGLLRLSRVKLLYKHEDVVAGTIEHLGYDAYGRLKIRCRVKLERARRCGGFSVGARIKSYEIVNADKPSFFARITDAELSEISLVDCPANPPALVCSRTPVPPLQFFDAALRYVDAIKMLVTLLPALSAATKSEGAAVRKRFPGLPIGSARITHERSRLRRRGPVGAPRSVSYFTFGRRKMCEPHLAKMRDEKCVASDGSASPPWSRSACSGRLPRRPNWSPCPARKSARPRCGEAGAGRTTGTGRDSNGLA